MDEDLPLCRALWAGLSPAVAASTHPDASLEATLAQVCADARAPWEGVVVEPALFLRYVGEHLPADRELATALRELRPADLYLACACVNGVARGVEALEARYAPKVRGAVATLADGTWSADDIAQHVIEKLVLPQRDGTCRLRSYAGRGDLLGWLCIAAVREARSLRRRSERETPNEGELAAEIASPAHNQEMAYLRRLYGEAFQEAFTQALAALEPSERNLLRYQLVHRLSIDEVGGLLKVHRATAARRIERAREKLIELTHAELMRRIQVGPEQLESIMRLISSEVHVSVGRLLGNDSEQE